MAIGAVEEIYLWGEFKDGIIAFLKWIVANLDDILDNKGTIMRYLNEGKVKIQVATVTRYDTISRLHEYSRLFSNRAYPLDEPDILISRVKDTIIVDDGLYLSFRISNDKLEVLASSYVYRL